MFISIFFFFLLCYDVSIFLVLDINESVCYRYDFENLRNKRRDTKQLNERNSLYFFVKVV